MRLSEITRPSSTSWTFSTLYGPIMGETRTSMRGANDIVYFQYPLRADHG